jgi:serine/threonine-protein kinase
MDATKSAELERLVHQEMGGEFQVQRELGRGGMAVVYLATETLLGRKVAIKVLPPDLTYGAGAIDRFKREARTAATLDHPSIIPVYRVSPGGRLFWYAMKYLEGQSLADLLKQDRRLSLERTIAILEQVAGALDYAHRRNVVHRDIKPANIMLDDDDRVVITDFGIAKQLSTGGLTASGSAVGTPYYMSPEQCTAVKTLTGAADQYSTAVMAYQMLSGSLPFDGDSAIEILQKHCSAPPPPLEVLRPGLPQHVYGAIDKALSKKPDQRFASVRAFASALKQPSPDIPTMPTRRASGWKKISTTTVAVARSRKTWVTVLSLAAVAGAGLGGVALRRMLRARQVTVSAARPSDTAVRNQSSAPGNASGVRSVAQDTSGGAASGSRPSTALPFSTQPAREVAPRQPANGRLTISGLPTQGTVFIDDQLRDGTSFTLPAGVHVVGLAAPGYTRESHAVEIKPGESVQLRFAAASVVSDSARAGEPTQRGGPQTVLPRAAATQRGVLVLRTTGGWARIHVDNVLRREGTSHRDTLLAGDHQVRLEREGYVTIDTTVTVRAGETALVTVTMRPRES